MLSTARSVALLIAIVVLAEAMAGCSRSQLRVIVPDPQQREGTVQVTTFTSHTDRGRMLSHAFSAQSAEPANLIFTFNPKPRWAYMVDVQTHFTPTQPQSNECILTCSHLVELLPGHSHRIETQIPILPNACSFYYPPDATAYEQANALCSAAQSLIQVPNCTFMVTSENSCTLICPNIAPDDGDPGAPSDQSGPANEDNGAPITPPTSQTHPDAGFDAGRVDASSSQNDVQTMDVQTYAPSLCGGVDVDCDGVMDSWSCGAGSVCVGNQCVPACIEGNCFAQQTCTSQGGCVDTACLSVACAPGELCANGLCHDACFGVTCTGGQVCRGGRCLSSCPER